MSSRKTPHQERAATQAYAQRDGYVIGAVATRLQATGGVSCGDQERAREEAKSRFPIYGQRRRVVEDEEYRYRVTEAGNRVEVQVKTPRFLAGMVSAKDLEKLASELKAEATQWRLADVPPTVARVRLLADLFEKPDEQYITDE